MNLNINLQYPNHSVKGIHNHHHRYKVRSLKNCHTCGIHPFIKAHIYGTNISITIVKNYLHADTKHNRDILQPSNEMDNINPLIIRLHHCIPITFFLVIATFSMLDIRILIHCTSRTS